MSTPEFIEWLDRKFTTAIGKVIPPDGILRGRLRQELQRNIQTRLTTEALAAAHVDENAAAQVEDLWPQVEAMNGQIESHVRHRLVEEPERLWTAPVDELAARLAEGSTP